ncbi:Eco57I restriction-modification methylase domain-containing protein [Thermus thermamylovorans]|uniref:site-specific DNA-methyltransferase (adenine-specific) n=1 Tax=Thermus thermamylovorans TaxID=2509362 RepID=A0A4Q9AW75_9DEIN|nr:Eco57I restriction-modification methylase domain-containing protein [Thermus thermamylovorans]TBH15322.1 restriction endonuclease [Thermus thermamylovorans]
MLSDDLVPYSREGLVSFLDALGSFAPREEAVSLPGGVTGELLGHLYLEDEVPVVALRVEEAARKRRKDWEPAARYLVERGLSAGLFVFYDGEGAYRLSLVHARYRGTRKPELSHYKRHSLIARPGEPNKTFFQRLRRMAENPPGTLAELLEIFSVEAVTEEFYREFIEVFEERLARGVVGEASSGEKRDFALAFVARVIFLGFVQKRGWLGGREDFLQDLLKRYEKAVGLGKDRFYREWLTPLFFRALKAPPGEKELSGLGLPPEVEKALKEAPYLNGELFSPKPGVDDRGLYLKDEAVRDFFGFLFAHNFTVEENDRYEEELELNPEFLGLILERLINDLGVEGKGGEVGAHYTPRVEVDLMCRLALAEHLHRQGLPLEKAYGLMRGEVEALTKEERAFAKQSLLEAKVLDPAVGSGAFLVGMLQVLEEVLEDLGEPRTLDLRKRLLQNLYGVDALGWAVWMTELRLWLAYFVELPDSAKASKEPLLPSLGLKVAHGDSLVQTLGETIVPVKLPAEAEVLKDEKVRKAYEALVAAKEDYFHNRGVSREEVEEKERAFLEAYAWRALLGKGQQPGLLVKGEAEQTEERYRQIEELLRQEERPFFYLLDFAEVLLGPKGGFDIVIGNPPYVRQEEIRDLFGRFDPGTYKKLLQRSAKEDLLLATPYTEKTAPAPSGRSDLYTYFYVRSLALLHPKGVHVFVVSNSWLDVQYGAWLQRVFLEAAPLRYVIENRVKRSFRADVNTAITVAHAPDPERKVPPDWPVLFVAVQKPFEEVDLLQEVLEASRQVGFASKEVSR